MSKRSPLHDIINTAGKHREVSNIDLKFGVGTTILTITIEEETKQEKADPFHE